MKKIILLFLFLSSCATKTYIKQSYQVIYHRQVTILELTYMIKTLDPNRILIVDLRPAKEYEKDHIQGAISIPYKRIRSLEDILAIQSKRIIFYDTKAVSFYRIKKQLKKLSITQFSLLQEGFNEWNTTTPSSKKYI